MRSNLAICNTTVAELNQEIATLNDQMWVLEDIITLRDLRIKELEEGAQEEYPYEVTNFKVVNGDVIERTMDKYGVKFHRSPMDTEYRIPTMVDVATWIDWSQINTSRYITNYRDCDKSARKAWGDYAWDTLCNNIVLITDYSGGHGYNAFFVWDEETDDIELWVLEPQNDLLWEFDNEVMTGLYDCEFGLWQI